MPINSNYIDVKDQYLHIFAVQIRLRFLHIYQNKKPKLLDTLKWIRVAFIQIQEVYRMSKEIWHLVIACMYRAFTFAYQNTF